MAYNFLRGDRDQPFLLPPDLRDWLPAGHLAWFILDVVDQLDLAPFYRPYRDDGHGHPAYDASHAPARLPRSATQHLRVLGRPGWFIPWHLTYSEAVVRWGLLDIMLTGDRPGIVTDFITNTCPAWVGDTALKWQSSSATDH
jgi:hypothetical protein